MCLSMHPLLSSGRRGGGVILGRPHVQTPWVAQEGWRREHQARRASRHAHITYVHSALVISVSHVSQRRSAGFLSQEGREGGKNSGDASMYSAHATASQILYPHNKVREGVSGCRCSVGEANGYSCVIAVCSCPTPVRQCSTIFRLATRAYYYKSSHQPLSAHQGSFVLLPHPFHIVHLPSFLFLASYLPPSPPPPPTPHFFDADRPYLSQRASPGGRPTGVVEQAPDLREHSHHTTGQKMPHSTEIRSIVTSPSVGARAQFENAQIKSSRA